MSRRSLAAQFVSPQKKSVIWRIFAENAVDRSKADCNICKASVSRGGANVTNFTTTKAVYTEFQTDVSPRRTEWTTRLVKLPDAQ